jgi:hypothetical protein
MLFLSYALKIEGYVYLSSSTRFSLRPVRRLHRALFVTINDDDGMYATRCIPLSISVCCVPWSFLLTHSFCILDIDTKPSAKRKMTTESDIISGDDGQNLPRTVVESSDLINFQKSRAIAQWDQAFAREDFEKSVYDEVLSHLKNGIVPPIYHALSREPAKRLFLPKTFITPDDPESGSIELSSDKVFSGICASKASIDKKVWDDKKLSYLNVFFKKDGSGFVNVIDGNSNPVNLVFNKKVTELVTALVNAPARMVGHDLEVTELEQDFPIDRLSGKNLITRSLSRGVVGDCFEHSVRHSTYSIVGTPGIGKSWNLIYALQQSLLYENACIALCFQKCGTSWVCIRKNHHIYVWTSKSEYFRSECVGGLLWKENVVVLLDPGESADGGASFCYSGKLRVIFAASFNRHHSRSIHKVTGRHARFLNPYTMDELKIALKYMSNTGVMYTDDEIAPMLERAKEVGCMPRYVLSSDASESPKKQVAEFLVLDDRWHVWALFDPEQGFQTLEWDRELSGGAFALHASGSIAEDDDVFPTRLDNGYDGDENIFYERIKVTYTGEYAKREIEKAYQDIVQQESMQKDE